MNTTQFPVGDFANASFLSSGSWFVTGSVLDNISIAAQYVFADIDVDSNNDGIINVYDDPIETGFGDSIDSGQYGHIVLAGNTFTMNLNLITNGYLDTTQFGSRITGGTGIVTYVQPTLDQTTLSATALFSGQVSLVYEIYSLSTGTVVATDSVLVTVNTPPHLRAHKDDSVICETEGYETGDYSTLAEIFHDANDTQTSTTIDLNSYFHDTETPDDLLYSIYSPGNSQIVSATLSDSILETQYTCVVGQTSITVQATDPHGDSETWSINVYSVCVN